MRAALWGAIAVGSLLAGCYDSTTSGDAGEDRPPDAAPDDAARDDVATDAPADDAAGISCPERVLPVACRALPPDCPSGTFPASDGTCWTGACLDCTDGCQRDEECVALQYCGCGYHEGCGWAETVFRQALDTDPCLRPIGEACPDSCRDVTACPPHCERDDGTERGCCGWCDPPDDTACVDGACVEIITHICY